MSEAEKRVAEWKARHDVATRGRRPGAETVQRYVAHERLVNAAQPHPAGVHATPPAPEQPVRSVPPARQSRLRSLLHRLLHRGH